MKKILILIAGIITTSILIISIKAIDLIEDKGVKSFVSRIVKENPIKNNFIGSNKDYDKKTDDLTSAKNNIKEVFNSLYGKSSSFKKYIDNNPNFDVNNPTSEESLKELLSINNLFQGEGAEVKSLIGNLTKNVSFVIQIAKLLSKSKFTSFTLSTPSTPSSSLPNIKDKNNKEYLNTISSGSNSIPEITTQQKYDEQTGRLKINSDRFKSTFNSLSDEEKKFLIDNGYDVNNPLSEDSIKALRLLESDTLNNNKFFTGRTKVKSLTSGFNSLKNLTGQQNNLSKNITNSLKKNK